MNQTRALGALVLSTILLAVAPAAASPAPREYDGQWIGPGQRFTVAGDPATTVRLTHRAVVVRMGETRLRARFGGRDEPSMPAIAVPLGQAGDGYLVRQEGGDSTGWTLLVVRDGILVPAAEPARPSFDGGFRANGSHTRTWVTSTGQLRSERTGGGHARRVWRWEVAGPGEGGEIDPAAPAAGTLVATRLR